MDNPPTIIVTGSSGLVGAHLIVYLVERGYNVRAFQRHLPSISPHPGITYYEFDLADVRDEGFVGANYIVHCAYRPTLTKYEREKEKNWDLEGTKKILELARRHNIKMLYLSSLAAHDRAESYYGKTKLAAERLFDFSRDLVLKPGLILGTGGGLIGRITKALQTMKLVPLIGGGKQQIQTLALEDLCRVIEVGIVKRLTGIYKVAHPAVLTMKNLYDEIAAHISAKPLYIPVPTGIAYWLLRTTEALGITLPFTSENVLGLKQLRVFDTASDVKAFGVELKDYKAAVRQL